MSGRKTWFLVPADSFPATRLPLGQLVPSLDQIDHPLNRTTLVSPPASEVERTVQTDFSAKFARAHHVHANFTAAAELPVGAEAGGGVTDDHDTAIEVDVVVTETLHPSDTYAAACFHKGLEEPDMVNYLGHSMKMPWRPSVFMVTGRKVGCTMALDTGDETAIEARAKASLAMQGVVKVGAALGAGWRDTFKVKCLSDAQPSVFAIQLRKIRYRSSPRKVVTTQAYIKSAMMERDGLADGREWENGGIWEHMPERILDEGPHYDEYDYEVVLQPGPDGEEEEFLPPYGET